MMQEIGSMWLALPVFPGVPEAWQTPLFVGMLTLCVAVLSGLGLLVVNAARKKTRVQGIEKAKDKKQLEPPLETDEGKTSKEAETGVPKKAKDVLLQSGLAKTRSGFVSKLFGLLGRKQVDAEILTQLEEILLAADVGVKTAQYLFERVKEKLSQTELMQGDLVLAALKEESRLLLHVQAPAPAWDAHKPFVILILGVNGVGKTTTIGKLASRFKEEGKQVLLAAGDTYRAAAAAQLSVWGQRVDAPVVQGKEGSDPSSVIFDAIKKGQQNRVDVVLADTAGRLHVKAQLMEELQKVRRVIKKAEVSAPHETWLVLDATMGQNAIAQAIAFKEMMEITGIVLTKLDGTAKGGVILGICHELQVPVRYVGVGEQANDLRAFDADAFVDALYETDAL